MKKKFLALAMASAVMLTGAGYAYWTDTLSIENTVSTGKFDVMITDAHTGGGTNRAATVTNEEGVKSLAPGVDLENGAGVLNGSAVEWGKYVYSDAYIAKHPETAECVKTEFSEDSVVASVGNLYPGSGGNLYITIKNNGTIPATFDYADVSMTGSDSLAAKLQYYIAYTKNGDKTSYTNTYDLTNGLATFETKLNNLLQGVRLEPGEELQLGAVEDPDNIQNTYSFLLPSTVVNGDNLEEQSLTLDIQMNWKQHNDGYKAIDGVVQGLND